MNLAGRAPSAESGHPLLSLSESSLPMVEASRYCAGASVGTVPHLGPQQNQTSADGLVALLLATIGSSEANSHESAAMAAVLRAAAADNATLLNVAERLKAEAERQLHMLPARSAAISKLIGRLGRAAERVDLTALGEMSHGDALRDQGRYAEALQAYDRAAEMYRACSDDVGWARTRIGAAATRRVMGDLAVALREAEQAREVLEAHAVWHRLARLDSVIGLVLRELGRYPEALGAYQRARHAAAHLALDDRELMEAELLINEAVVHLRIDDYSRAEDYLRAAAATFRLHNRLAPMAQAEANRARVLAAQGHVSQALSVVRDARHTLRELGRLSEAAMVGQVGVQCWLALNRASEASALADELVEELEASHARNELARTLLDRAVAREEIGEPQDAEADLKRAEELFAASDSWTWVALARIRRAELLQRMGDWQAALNEARAAKVGLDRMHHNVELARASLVEAHALRQLGDATRAARLLASVRASARHHGVPWLTYQAWRLDAELAMDAGDSDRALRALRRAIAAHEIRQGRILIEQRATFLADKLGVYEEAIRLCFEQGRHREAFYLAERAKGRALVDALGLRAVEVAIRPRTANAQPLIDELEMLRRRHNRLTEAEDESRSTLYADEVRIATLLEELRLTQGADMERLALLQGRVYSPLRWLGQRTGLIEYVAVGQRIAIFLLRPGHGITAVWAPGEHAMTDAARLRTVLDLSLEAAAHGRRDLVHLEAASRHTRTVLQRLHTLLLGPLGGSIDGLDRLAIVPHGVLHSVPFAALHDGRQYLIERFEISLAPSASAVVFCRRPTRYVEPRALIVGHSAGGMLPGVVAETGLVQHLFPGTSLLEEAATVDAVRDAAASADLIHVAAHGMSRPDAPLFSHVRLEAGQLTALDFLDLQLDCALVTLSACETGHAVVAPGDDMIGLTRSLLYAGARSILQSLWRVDDRATQHFMSIFYAHLRHGAGRAAAVRAAQRTLLAGSDDGQHRHPFFWAAFNLVGDWTPIVKAHSTYAGSECVAST